MRNRDNTIMNECQKAMEAKRKIVIFGAGLYAETLSDLIDDCTNWDIVAYCVDREYLTSDSFRHQPLVSFEELPSQFPSDKVEMMLACGYSDMGDLRERIFKNASEQGYRFPNLIHPTAKIRASAIGAGNVIAEYSVLEYRVAIGNCNSIGSSCSIAHDVGIGNYCFFAMRDVVGGEVQVDNHCFLGLSSIIQNGVHLAPYTLVGAGCYLNHSTNDGESYALRKTTALQGMSSKRIMSFWNSSKNRK